MIMLRRIRLTREMLLRIAADILMLNGSLFIAFALRFLLLVVTSGYRPNVDYSRVSWDYLLTYRNSFWLLTIISLLIFSLSGFYTYSRAYRSRFKTFIVTQAVTAGYLLFGLLVFFLGGAFRLPTDILVLAWFLSLTSLVLARMWSLLWTNLVLVERRFFKRPAEHKVHNVLVIGGAGYIGSSLLPKLLEKGYQVRLLDLLLYGTEPIKDVMEHPRLEIIQADFRQVDRMVEAMQGMDAVIHLGAIVGDPACALDEKLTIEINLTATRMIAEIAKGREIPRFIFASTCSVYGASDEILDEHSALKPISLYALSKLASEKVLLNLASHTFSPTLLRFGTIYGLSGRIRFDLVINLLTAKALVEGKITVHGGDQWRPFLHVDDAASAILKVLESPLPLVAKQVFNVGSDEQNYTITQIGEIIHKMVPSAELISMGSDSDKRNYRVRFNKIRQMLGFLPQQTVEQGIEQIIRVIKDGTVKNYHDDKYSNVKFLQKEHIFSLIRREDDWEKSLMKEIFPDDS